MRVDDHHASLTPHPRGHPFSRRSHPGLCRSSDCSPSATALWLPFVAAFVGRAENRGEKEVVFSIFALDLLHLRYY